MEGEELTSYEPIDCSLHDELEARATRGKPCVIRFRDVRRGQEREVSDRIVDVFARSGEEFVRLASGEEIRLDRLQAVDGVVFGDAGGR